jgi:glutamate N-acetyltransferase / amino-acid N-acetyltransferase
MSDWASACYRHATVKHKVFADWNVYLESSASADPSEDVVSLRSRTLEREVAVEPTLVHQPGGMSSAAVAAGVKSEGVLDFAVVKLQSPGPAAAVFTKSLCPGHAVVHAKQALADGRAQLLAVVSKNANVFTPYGDADTRTLVHRLADEFRVRENDVVLSCTGVIGVPLPMEKLERAVAGFSSRLRPRLVEDAARAILTTDRGPKVCSTRIGDVVVCSMAKGAGMIEPSMATMLAYFFTNVDIDADRLKAVLTDAVERTFNSISVDSDTSTSDTVVLFSTAEHRPLPDEEADFVDAVRCMSVKLARDIVAQSEGATKLIECTVHVDTSPMDAKRIAKQIVNSPLVKTAVHGGDPNWGRLVAAIGKPDERTLARSIAPSDVAIEMMGQQVFCRAKPTAWDSDALARTLRASTRVTIDVRIGEGRHTAKVWGCDLSARYVEINADYTT